MARRASRTRPTAQTKVEANPNTEMVREATNEVKKAYSMCRDRSINNVLARAIEKLETAVPPKL